jgi:GNAT superfamily N-acetyltransferase
VVAESAFAVREKREESAMTVRVRPFHRADRDQLTALVNAHAAAVVPNASVSVQALMSQLERDPGEFIVDPWVEERATLVAEQRGRIVAGAHLLRYGRDERVSPGYRGAGEIRWLLCWPAASYWPDADQAGDALATAALAVLDRWRVDRGFADGTLPVPGVYGVPEQWPHVRAIYERAGFRADGRIEAVFLGRVADLPRPDAPPLPGLTCRRTVGVNGTRLSAVHGSRVIGYIEVDTTLDAGSRSSRLGGWADIGNLHVDEGHRPKGVATWLLGLAAEWLELGGVARVLDYATVDEPGYEEQVAFLVNAGFRELTRTVRGMVRDSS